MTQKITYDRHGRMQYHPDYHHNHKKTWTNFDEKYLIENYSVIGPELTALGLGRTIGVVMTRAYELRKEGKMPKRKPGDPFQRRTRQISKMEAGR